MKEVINTNFKEELLKFLEKRGYLEKPLTPEIRSIIKSIQDWDPSMTPPIGYIMSTFEDADGMVIANNIDDLCQRTASKSSKNLTRLVREASFILGVQIARDGFSGG